MSVQDWRKRLRADPRGTLAELAQSLIETRASDRGLEDLFWRALADFGTPEELARAVLGRLRVGPEEAGPGEVPELLDLDREHRVRVHGQLRLAAAEALRGIVRDREERARVEAHPARLPEVALERRGRPAEAAALYALEHDLLPSHPRNRLAAAAEPLARAALCYQLARALHRVPGETERAVAVMEGVLVLLVEAQEHAAAGEQEALPLRLSYHAREWLGLRHYEARRYRDAVRQFLRAAEAAPDTDLELAAGIFAANALIRDGRRAEARRLLDSLRERASRVDPDLSQEWEALLRKITEPDPDEPGAGGS